MSRHHAAHAGDVAHIINDIHDMSFEDAEKMYGVKIEEDGKVFDVMYKRSFGSVSEWAEFNVQQDELEYAEDINTYKTDHPRYG